MAGLSLVKRISTAVRILRGTAHEDWVAFFGAARNGRKTKAGPAIDESSAMTISAVFAALNFLGGVVASLPLRVYRSLPGGGKARAVEHPLYDRLHAKPNSTGLTAWQWIYTSMLHKYLWGNWWTALSRPSLELTPLLPDRTWIDPRVPQFVQTRDNAGGEIVLDRRDVLLIPHVSLGGVTGKGIVHYARESLGLMKAQEEFASTFFGSGIKAGGFVEIPEGKTMSEDTRQGLQKDFNDKYAQLGESWKAIFLSGGAEWKPNEVDAQKAQALESRQFSIAEVSRWTGLTPHLLHDLSRATFSNIEELDLALVMFTLTPIVSQAEQAMNVTFFDDRERAAGYYVKFELKGLLRGNLQARTQFYTQMLDRGVFHADDVLELEDMNPQRDGLGQAYLVPLNMVNKTTVVGGPARLTIEPAMRDVTPRPKQIAAPARMIAQRTSALRRKITIAYSKQWEAYAKRILGEEIEQLRPGVEQWLGERSATEFVAWMETFYGTFRKRIGELSAPLIASYAGAILPVAQQEVGSDADLGPQFDQFVGQYRDTFVLRHAGHSQGALAKAAKEAEDPRAAVSQVLDEWAEARADRIRLHESVRAESALARQVFKLAGIVKIRSIAYGSNCPYCRALDGRVVGIEEPFLEAGDFSPEGSTEPLVVTTARRHPPYHGSCDCGIEAST